jgi:hypothetical protein
MGKVLQLKIKHHLIAQGKNRHFSAAIAEFIAYLMQKTSLGAYNTHTLTSYALDCIMQT